MSDKRYIAIETVFNKDIHGETLAIEGSVIFGATCVYSYSDDIEDFDLFEAEKIAEILNEAVEPLHKRIAELEALSRLRIKEITSLQSKLAKERRGKDIEYGDLKKWS